MKHENPRDIEIRKLPAGSVFKLSQILECGEGWKQLMSVIPVSCKEGNPPKYTVEHMKLIETAGMCQKRPYSEILLEEWGTSGRFRPTVSVLLQCLVKAELFRAADFVAVELLNEAPPSRPELDHTSEMMLASNRCANYTPSAPPPPTPCTKSTPTPQEQSPPSADTPQNPTVLVESDMCEVVQLKYAELESATENFADNRILGGGAWGCVYQANLPRLGAVAVKKLHLTGVPWDPRQQFHNEVEVLARLSHPNLLPLLGFSSDGPALCLAYKFMKHGSLLDKLAYKYSKMSLLWKTRIEIALGTARGICHLHTSLQKPLVHRDVKSANILLDDNLNPKLGDFGLVRLGAGGNHTHTVALTTNVIGTSAYMAPEAHRGDVSVKLDVFSFGVVLLELLTGLPPYDETREGRDLVTHVEDTDDQESLLDTKAGNWPPDTVINLFNLSFQCLKDKKERPNISAVVEILEKCLS